MAASTNRTEWALLLLRVAVVQGFGVLRYAHGAITFAHANVV